MSLTTKEQRQTSAELHQNLALSGLTVGDIEVDLAFSPERARAALDVVSAGDPADVWLVRDYLERAVLDAGGHPVPFTVLTEPSRRLARQWFALQDAPRHHFV